MFDRRKDVRMPVRLEVRWNGFSSATPAVTADISLGGCYIESLHPIKIGDVLHFDFSAGELFQLRGQVLYQHPNTGFGVRFIDSSAKDRILDLFRSPVRVNRTFEIPSTERRRDKAASHDIQYSNHAPGTRLKSLLRTREL